MRRIASHSGLTSEGVHKSRYVGAMYFLCSIVLLYQADFVRTVDPVAVQQQAVRLAHDRLAQHAAAAKPGARGQRTAGTLPDPPDRFMAPPGPQECLVAASGIRLVGDLDVPPSLRGQPVGGMVDRGLAAGRRSRPKQNSPGMAAMPGSSAHAGIMCRRSRWSARSPPPPREAVPCRGCSRM